MVATGINKQAQVTDYAIQKKNRFKVMFGVLPWEFYSEGTARFWVHYGLVILGFVIGLATLISQWTKPAPYGKHDSNEGNWGVLIPQRLGHIVSDAIPGTLLFVLVFSLYGDKREYTNYVFLCLWLLHYIYRGFIHPLVMRYKSKTVPLGITLGGLIPNVLFNFINADFIGNANFDNNYYYDPRFIIGILMYLLGMVINRWSDFKLRSLRAKREEQGKVNQNDNDSGAGSVKQRKIVNSSEQIAKGKVSGCDCKEDGIFKSGPSGYSIPRGGLFELVTCPNYFGEMVQWIGWSIASWSLAGLMFALFSIATFIPRSWHNHKWYILFTFGFMYAAFNSFSFILRQQFTYRGIGAKRL